MECQGFLGGGAGHGGGDSAAGGLGEAVIWSISASLVRASAPADLQSLGLADLAAGFGFGDAADQVVAGLGEVGTFVTSAPFPMPAPHPHAACRPRNPWSQRP